jgi:hypothetical protein
MTPPLWGGETQPRVRAQGMRELALNLPKDKIRFEFAEVAKKVRRAGSCVALAHVSALLTAPHG